MNEWHVGDEVVHVYVVADYALPAEYSTPVAVTVNNERHVGDEVGHVNVVAEFALPAVIHPCSSTSIVGVGDGET